MSIYLHATIEVHGAGMGRFQEIMGKEVVPFMESQGWRLLGAFVQRTGRLNTVIDIWELEDMQHFDRALRAFAQEATVAATIAVIQETVISETLVFADRASFMH
jgi:hypothetical protein